MKTYNEFSIEKYEILEKKECFTFGLAPVPFMAYKVKTGEIFNEGEYVGDIIRWMHEDKYKEIVG